MLTVQEADVIIFSVKPQQLSSVLDKIKNIDFSGKTLISIMAGVPLSTLKESIRGKSAEAWFGFSNYFF